MTICLPPPLIPEEPQTPEEPQVFLGKSILMSPPPVTASHLALVKSAATTASLCSAGKCEPVPLLFTNAAIFVKGKDLKKELESMEGYDNRDWKTLRKSMLDVWGGLPLKICYTIQDLYDLIKLCQDKGGIKDIKDFKIYQSKFMMIAKYLVQNKHIPAKTCVSHLFFLAFPQEYQVSINRELVKSDLIPTRKDGYHKPPILEDVMEVAEDGV
ncbi:hypothetical protein PCASD_23562 [Puccinia coronata f. sp. avenae]|uniref:Uncharacterized protein n=1 Tax=Puccinia coronata f. sp. avenae TaxID=200324 RepID=A0A2N5SQW1_9BASI|nr:hypothetical protein PCASD_23562 [Puccinia coronata f. sp. avenae]